MRPDLDKNAQPRDKFAFNRPSHRLLRRSQGEAGGISYRGPLVIAEAVPARFGRGYLVKCGVLGITKIP